jgi:hypothetical protein
MVLRLSKRSTVAKLVFAMDTPRPRLGILEFAQSVLGIHPYPWQRRTLAHIEAGHPTALTACNGAGKTSTILVPAGLWALFNWPLARVIVTSASWSQLKKQFFDTIRQARFHPYFRRWTFNEAEIRTPEGGFIVGVSVDEAGRAEGYHERPDSPVMILADEVKSIGTEVFESLARCTATFRVYASSAGPAVGTFYACLTTFRNFWASILVKSLECPHISKESIELDRAMWGEHSPQFRRSIWPSLQQRMKRRLSRWRQSGGAWTILLRSQLGALPPSSTGQPAGTKP